MSAGNFATDPDRGHHASARFRDGGRSESFEDCAKAIFALQRRFDGPATTNSLAERLGVTPGSVTATLKRMAAVDLIDYEPYRGATLTQAGQELALEMLRHHRLLETYLAKELNMPWDRVHAEAEVLEHHISEELEERIAAALGEPRFDPHGDPIPGPELQTDGEAETTPLTALEIGESGRLARVSDSDPALLRFLSRLGLKIGSLIELVGRQEFGGPLFLRIDGSEHALGRDVAERMRVDLS